MTAGSLTTIGGFLCVQFIDAPVLRDLGLFAALSLAGAAIATLVVLPHFVKSSPPTDHVPDDKMISPFTKLTGFVSGHQKLALLFLILTPVFLYFAGGVKFETDMYKIKNMLGGIDTIRNSRKSIQFLLQEIFIHCFKR